MVAVLSPPPKADADADADLFGPVPAAQAHAPAQPVGPSATCTLSFTGTLRRRADVRTKVCDSEGHHIPVLHLELEGCGTGHHTVLAEVPYTDATRAMAEHMARNLPKGQQVTVTTHLTDMRLLLPSAALVSCHPVPPLKQTATRQPQPQEANI